MMKSIDAKVEYCAEAVVHKGQRVNCPNESIGYYRDGDVYEMRKYPMCAAHVALNGHWADPELIKRDKESWTVAVNRAIITQMQQLADALMESE